MVMVFLNRYDREQFNKTEPFASLDSMEQLVSVMATFSLCSNMDSIPAQKARARCGRGNIECISTTNDVLHMDLSFQPIRCIMTQNDTF